MSLLKRIRTKQPRHESQNLFTVQDTLYIKSKAAFLHGGNFPSYIYEILVQNSVRVNSHLPRYRQSASFRTLDIEAVISMRSIAAKVRISIGLYLRPQRLKIRGTNMRKIFKKYV